ncbi:MAG: hypothetical protein ABJG78_19965 [Cyclobacteriaceae bacterium]
MKRKTSLIKSSSILLVISGIFFTNLANAQTAKIAMEVYEEGPIWQIMTFKAPPGRVEMTLKNTSKVWRHQLELAKEKGFMVDYKVLTKWAASPDDWNIMVVEIFPNWASYDTFWKDWNEVDEQTVFTEEFREIMEKMEPTGSEFLGTVFAREIYLK